MFWSTSVFWLCHQKIGLMSSCSLRCHLPATRTCGPWFSVYHVTSIHEVWQSPANLIKHVGIRHWLILINPFAFSPVESVELWNKNSNYIKLLCGVQDDVIHPSLSLCSICNSQVFPVLKQVPDIPLQSCSFFLSSWALKQWISFLSSLYRSELKRC